MPTLTTQLRKEKGTVSYVEFDNLEKTNFYISIGSRVEQWRSSGVRIKEFWRLKEIKVSMQESFPHHINHVKYENHTLGDVSLHSVDEQIITQ